MPPPSNYHNSNYYPSNSYLCNKMNNSSPQMIFIHYIFNLLRGTYSPIHLYYQTSFKRKNHITHPPTLFTCRHLNYNCHTLPHQRTKYFLVKKNRFNKPNIHDYKPILHRPLPYNSVYHTISPFNFNHYY